MLFIALMGLLSSGTPIEAKATGDPANWVRASDIPSSESSHATVTSYDLTVDNTGKPIACTIINPSGSSSIDAIVCSSLLRRAHYKPAKDAAGNPLPSVIRDHVEWRPDASGPNQYLLNTPDVIVSSDAASSKRKFDLVRVIEIITSSGVVESCSVYKSSKIEKLDSEACATASRSELAKPIFDSSNSPLRGVRAFNIGFLAGTDDQIFVR